MLSFEAELAHLPRSLIIAIWTALDSLDSLDSRIRHNAAESPQLMRGRFRQQHEDRSMNYPAILTDEGTHTLIVFPDLPGCQAYASVNDNLLRFAQDTLTQYLRESLMEAGAPPFPSEEIKVAGAVRVLVVPVPDDLARALEDRWHWVSG